MRYLYIYILFYRVGCTLSALDGLFAGLFAHQEIANEGKGLTSCCGLVLYW